MFCTVPHTFEKSAGRSEVNIQDDDESPSLGTVPFSPRYPMYHFDTNNQPAVHSAKLPTIHAQPAKNYSGDKIPSHEQPTRNR